VNLRRTIDCQYLDPGVGACFVLESDGEFALVESGTARSASLILAELRTLNVPFSRIKYLIATHAHLDHAGGLHVLSASIPDATVVLHPNAALHLAAPKTLVAGTKAVFGQQRYDEYFQEVRALDPEKILAVEHGRTLRVGSQDIEFLHTLGHATHHLCVWDRARGVVFTGDAFGMF
jgi:glyoxylase-like metal-dependent hydrolase (beta-lactamase superfamily II)